MTDPVRDDAELYRVFDYARNHPENWDQEHFRRVTDCGTTYCIAGFKAFVFDKKNFVDSFDASGYAMDALGLTPREANALFWDAMSPESVEETMKKILNNEYREQ